MRNNSVKCVSNVCFKLPSRGLKVPVVCPKLPNKGLKTQTKLVKYSGVVYESVTELFVIVFVFIVLCYSFICLRTGVLYPRSGEEKDVRRELYYRKKASKKSERRVLQVTSRVLSIPKVTKRTQLDDIYKGLPDFLLMEPKGGMDVSKKDAFLKRIFGVDVNKLLVEKIVALFESLSFLLLNMYQASSKKHQVCILLMWVQNRFLKDKSVLLNMTDIICWFSGFKPSDIVKSMDSLKDVCSGSISLSSLFDGVEEDKFDVVDPASAVETPHATAYAQSETITRFKGMLQMFVDAGLCSIFGYSFDLTKAQGCLDWVNTSLGKIELVEYVSSTIMYFVKRGYAAYDKGSIKHLFFSDEWICFDLEFVDVQTEMASVLSGYHVGQAPNVTTLRGRILRLISIVRKSMPSAPFMHRKVLSDRLLKLNDMQKDLIALDRKSGMRKAPVSMLIWGHSGVCKSWVSITLMYSVLKHLGLPCDEYFVRTPNLADEFDSVLDADTVGVILDDLANEKMEMLKSSPVDCLLRLINNIVAMANKAALAEKGSVFLEPQVVVASANNKTMNAHMYSIEQISILRRLDNFIHVHMDPIYMSAGKSDLSKWPEENRKSGMPPLTYTVEKVSAQDGAIADPQAPLPNATYTHVAQVPVFNVVTWRDPITGQDIVMHRVDFITLERYCCHQAELKLRDQESFMRTVKRTANPLKCLHHNTFPYCVECKPKMMIVLSAIIRWRYIVKSRYSFVFTWRHGIDIKSTHKDTPRPKVNRKLEKVSLRRSMYSYVTRGLSNYKLNKPCYQVKFVDGKYRHIDFIAPKIVKPSVVPVKTKLVMVPSSATLDLTPPLRFSPVFDDVDDIPTDTLVDALRMFDQGFIGDQDDISIGSYFDAVDSDHSSDDDSDSDSSIDFGSDYSDTDRDSDWQRSYDELHQLDFGPLFPRAGFEEEKVSDPLSSHGELLGYWSDMCNWWNHLAKVCYITQIDVGLLDLAYAARRKLHFRKIMQNMPLDFSTAPVSVPAPSDGMFAFYHPEKHSLARVTDYYVSFKSRVINAQKRYMEITHDIDDSDDDEDEEEFTKFKRFTTLLALGTSRCLAAPFSIGKWLRSKGSERKASVIGLGSCITGCLLSLTSVFFIPSLFLSVMASICISCFWGSCSVAIYVGIAHSNLIKFCKGTRNTCRFLARISRKALKNKHAIIFGSLALVAVGATYYRYRTKKKRDVFHPSGSEVSTPIPRTNERTNNYWVANKVSIESSCGISGYQNTPEELLNTIGSQLVRVRIYPKEIRSISQGPASCDICCGITMAGGLLVVPKHIAKGKEGHLISVMRSAPGNVRNNANWIIPDDSIFYVEGVDLAFIYTVHLGAAKDLKPYLPTKITKDTFRVKWLLKETSVDEPFENIRGTAEAVYNNTTQVAGVGVYEGYNMSLYDSDGNSLVSKKGWCMSVFVTQTNPSALHSVYLAGRDHAHRSVPLLRQYVDSALEYFSNAGHIMLPASGTFTPGKGGILDSAGKRSPISHLHMCDEVDLSFDWLGSSTEIQDFRRMSGRVRDTPFAACLKEVFGVDYEWKSPMYLSGWQPWFSNLIHMGVKLDAFEPDIFETAKNDLRESLLEKCESWRGFEGETFSDVVHPVSQEVAINGVPGVSGCDRIKMQTSAGYPLNCSKKKVFDVVEDENYPEGRLEPHKVVQDHIDFILDCAEKDVRSNVTFRASPKDEPTVTTKEKVRIFAGCPVAYLIAVRMYTCTLVKFMTDNHLLFDTVAGANAHDYDWTLIGQFMVAFSVNRLIGGDYVNYDKKLLAHFMMAAVELTLDMLRLAGYTPLQLLIAKNLLVEACYAIYEWNGDFILVNGTNPSGQPLTVWLNNLCNLLYMRYVFYTFYEKSFKFDRCVSILVMGDDNLLSVKPDFDKFNHTSIQKVLGSRGLDYTMADKSPISKPYITIDEATLLKRRFVWSEEFECYLCPIEEKSIYRCLYSHMLENGDKSETLRDHCMHMCDTALAEWFYFGAEIYEDRLDKIKLLLDKTDMSEHKVRLLSYEDQCFAFKSRILKSRCLFGKELKFSWLDSFEPKIDVPVEFLSSGEVMLEPSGGFAGYELRPEFGFRELFFGRKIETDVEYWKIWNRRSLFIVDQQCGVDVWSVLGLFEQQCWIDTFPHLALGIHYGDFFNDDDPRLLYRRGDWVLVIQDDELHKTYIRSLKAGVLSSITNC